LKEQLRAKFREFSLFYDEFYALLIEVVDKTREGDFTNADGTDQAFLLRETSKIAEELRKECDAKLKLISQVIAMRVAKKMMQDPELESTVRGELATGTVDCKEKPAIPKVGSPEYAKLCEFFKVPAEEVPSGVIRFHYPTLVDIMQDMAARGENPPDGIIKTYPDYTLTLRRRKNS